MWKALNGLPKGWLQKCFPYISTNTVGSPSPVEIGAVTIRHGDFTSASNEGQSTAHGRKPPPFYFTDKPQLYGGCIDPVQVIAPVHLDHEWREKLYSRQKYGPGRQQFSDDFFDFIGFGFFVAAGLRLSRSGYFGNDERKKNKAKHGNAWDALASTLFGMAFARPGIGLHRMVLPVGSLVPSTPSTSNSSEAKHEEIDQSAASLRTKMAYPLLEDHMNRLQDLARQYTALAFNSDALRLIDENDWKKAVEYLQKASELGLDKAVFNLGVCHELGQGVEQNFSKACQYYRKAAELGHTSAVYNLAIFNLEGRGVPVNEAEGLRWMEKASDGGVKEAQTFLGIRSAQNEDYQKAFTLFKMAAEQQHADAEYFLGVCYANGLGVDVDYQASARLFKKSADAGNAEACYALASCHESGTGGIPRDNRAAVEYFYRAATLGHPLAIKRLEWGLMREDKASETAIPSRKSDGLRSVSSLPNLEQFHQSSDVPDGQVPNKENSSSVFDFTKFRELFIGYWKIDSKCRGDEDEDCGLVTERELVNTKTLLA